MVSEVRFRAPSVRIIEEVPRYRVWCSKESTYVARDLSWKEAVDLQAQHPDRCPAIAPLGPDKGGRAELDI